MIFGTRCLGRSKILPYDWKYHKNQRHLCLLTHIFTKHSHNVCPIDTHILMYQYARCDCKLLNSFWLYRVFLGIFIHYWRAFKSEVLYLHQTFADCMSQNLKLADRHAFLIFVWIVPIYGPFGSFWKSQKSWEHR